jgi:hypothetical protein
MGPSRGSVTLSAVFGCVPNDSLLSSLIVSRLEERRRWVKSLKSTILDRAARRRDACWLWVEVGRVEGIGHVLLVEFEEGRGSARHSSEAEEGLAVALLALDGGHGLVMKAS